MKKKILALALSLAMAVTMLPATSVRADEIVPKDTVETIVTAGDASAEPVDNWARSATPSADRASDVAKINDGSLVHWHCWAGEALTVPMNVTLTWEDEQTLSSMRVMWWADQISDAENYGVQFPSSAKVQYKEGGEWKDITSVGVQHGGTNGQDSIWNVVDFGKEYKTTALRMVIEPTNKSAMGISEWEVFGAKLGIAGAKIAGQTELAAGQTAVYTGSVIPLDKEAGTAYEWSVASGSEDKIEIEGENNQKTVTVKGKGEGNATLHLKATKDGVSREKDFVISVKGEETLLAYDLSLLQELGVQKNNFELPAISQNGYTITWSSSNKDAVKIETGEDGKIMAMVTRIDEEQSVVLTATIIGKEGEIKKTVDKSFNVTLPKENLARFATVTGSYKGGWGEELPNINDENNMTGWNGHNHVINTQTGEIASEEWIQYDFVEKLELTGSTIRYKDENGGVVVPSKVEFQYTDGDEEYNEASWKTVPNDEGWTYNPEANVDNNYGFGGAIVVKKIRLKVTNGKTRPAEGDGVLAAAYIYEWGLTGKKYVKPERELAKLDELITNAKALNTEGKDQATVTAFTNAITEAERVKALSSPLKAEVDAAFDTLNNLHVQLGGEAAKKDIETFTITFAGGNAHEYTGTEIKPEVIVMDGETPLTADDFTVEYAKDSSSVGDKTVTIKAAADSTKYEGSTTKTYKITARRLTEANTEITLTMPENIVAGTQVKPEVAVKVTIADGNIKTLTKDTDYTVVYGENNTSGTDAGSVTITGKGNYAGSIEKKFDIAASSADDNMNTLTVTFPNEGKFEYTGAEIKPVPVVKDGETALVSGTDFVVEYPADVTALGEKPVTIIPGSNGKYKGSKTAAYEITARRLTNDNTSITLTMPENIVEGTQMKPEVDVKVTIAEGDIKTLVKDTDYTAAYGDNNTTGAEAGSVTITGKGNYAGSIEKKFAIGSEQPTPGPETKTDLRDAVVTVPDCTYNKKAQTPAVTVKVGEKTLVKDTDYTVAYEDNTNAGTAKAVVVAKEGSDYTGRIEKAFTIKKANAVISAKNITKTIGAKDFGFGASVDSGAALSYKSSNTKVIKVVKGKAQIVKTGTAKITITAAATANYNAAAKTITIKVNGLKQAKISKVENKKSKQLKVTWKKDSNAAGYKVMYSTDKKFKNKKVTKTITIKKNKTTSYTIKKLKKGKKYYVKVCSYVKVGKKQVLGKYSKVKNIKIKK